MARLPTLLGTSRFRRLVGVAAVVQGLLGVIAPRQTIRLSARLGLRELYENPGDLEPTDSYVATVRDASVATLLFGLLTLRRAGREAAAGEAEPTEDEAPPDAVEVELTDD